MKRHFLILTLILIISIVPACFSQRSGSAAENLAGTSFSIAPPSGKFGVGRQLIYLSDESREEREIAVWIYYPAQLKDKSLTEIVLPADWANGYRNLSEKRLGPAANGLLSAKSFTQTGAPVAGGNEKFPVLVFAPGANWLPTDYSTIIEELTSHGYVVLAFAAPPLSPVIRYSNANVVESPRVDETTYKIVTDDFRFIAGRIEKLNQDSTLKIKGRLDVTKIGTIGHSIGGAAAIAAANDNSQISAAVNLDGDFAGETQNASPAQPILYLTTEPPNLNGAPIEKWDEDRSETRRKNVWEKIKARSPAAIRVRVATMFHSNFQDAALLPVDSMPEKLRHNRFGKIEGARGIKLSTDLVLFFFNAQLKSNSMEDLLRIEKQYPEIRIEAKDQ